ncbi:DUF2213 domain-containing protein [Budvicia aquatica]|uniref:DUF2213 domain-containing protein n=1 Tax=Budvicia aquatica TaxID=82979 RepID=A0A2C6CWW6_9GAMM|nr:DUF2213 domain-containing protein [Budvicia aquatica]PHI31169.1 DUF2213 domain-containing protein [Budvicia aquatica]VFS51426.1 Uncharacterized protein conserved in bacteria [Budvicia aquatica]
MNLTELEVAEGIRDGRIPSPFEFSGMWLVNLRITGTGAAYRRGLDEHVWRDPDIYLNDAFLKRCNGLPVIIDHPEEAKLSEEDFKNRIVGAVMLPYIKGDEVWAIARVYQNDIVEQIKRGEVSTSPSVIFNQDSGNVAIDAGDETILIEGKPFLIDHIALVTKDHGTLGVWDKNKIPEGVENSNKGDFEMTEEELKKLLADSFGTFGAQINTRLDSFGARMDSMEGNAQKALQARADADEQAKKDADEKAAKDAADDKARADAAEKEAEEKARKDEAAAAEQAKKDADEKAVKDAAEEQERQDNAEKDEESKADAQVMADSAYREFGKSARAPMSGETTINYRKRMVNGLKQHSATYKDVDIIAIADSALLAIAEKQVYADAKATAKSKIASTPNVLIPVVRMDDAGRRITEYRGDVNTWLSSFKQPSQQLVKFNTVGSKS